METVTLPPPATAAVEILSDGPRIGRIAAAVVSQYLVKTVGVKKVTQVEQSSTYRIWLTGITGAGKKSAYLHFQGETVFFNYESMTAPLSLEEILNQVH